MYVCMYVYIIYRCMSCHKAIVMIAGRAHCFHDCIHITPILLLRDLSTVCVMDQWITYDHLLRIFFALTYERPTILYENDKVISTMFY